MYEFSIGWLLVGLVILIVGTLITVFYRQISENLGNGVSSYQNVKKFGIITIIIGFLVAVSLHTLFLNWLISLFFQRS